MDYEKAWKELRQEINNTKIEIQKRVLFHKNNPFHKALCHIDERMIELEKEQ